MKFFFSFLSICAIFCSFGAFKAVGNELDEVICSAMKGMQAQEEKLKEAKILLRERDRVTRKFNIVENKDYKEDFPSKLDNFSIKQRREN